MSKVRGLSIEPHSSTICIDLLMYVHVVRDYSVIKLHNHGIICKMQELGNEAIYIYITIA